MLLVPFLSRLQVLFLILFLARPQVLLLARLQILLLTYLINPAILPGGLKRRRHSEDLSEEGLLSATEQGTHEELLATGGLYARLFNEQKKLYEEEAGA